MAAEAIAPDDSSMPHPPVRIDDRKNTNCAPPADGASMEDVLALIRARRSICTSWRGLVLLQVDLYTPSTIRPRLPTRMTIGAR